jgi:hypothetical protein
LTANMKKFLEKTVASQLVCCITMPFTPIWFCTVENYGVNSCPS